MVNQDDNEKWVPVVGYPNYLVSNLGRIKSLFHRYRIKGVLKEKRRDLILKTYYEKPVKGSPYRRATVVLINSSGKAVHKKIAVLVLEAFLGPHPVGLIACHNDGNCENNRLENLRWDTYKSNTQDAIKHGRFQSINSRYPNKIYVAKSLAVSFSKNHEPLVVILAGGRGTRLGTQSDLIPKPMVQIGGMPLLWHIMKTYESAGLTNFLICGGYKNQCIKDFFINYLKYTSDFTISLDTGSIFYHNPIIPKWRVTVIDTGENTETGGRLKQIIDYCPKRICVTYGDGVSNIDIKNLLEFHEKNGKLATISAVHARSQFGELWLDNQGNISSFREKLVESDRWINGGFCVIEKEALQLLDPSKSFEEGLLHLLTENQQLNVYKHEGFWQCCDTQRDLKFLNDLWETNKADWKTWS